MISITNLTRRNPPARLAEAPAKRAGGPKNNWEKIKDGVLGKKYDLSLVFAGNNLMKKLNSRYRGKDQPASVLSFSLSKKEGEIFINLSQKEHPPLFLFIHALLHLKNFEHGVKMKEQEEKLRLKSFHGPRYSNRP